MSYYLEGEVAFIYITDKHTKKYRNLAITILRIVFPRVGVCVQFWPSYRVERHGYRRRPADMGIWR